MSCAVVAFAKKTGDIAVVSQTDLSVIALTYQYEVKENGDKNIRTEPGQKKVSPSSVPKLTEEDTSKRDGGDEEDSKSEHESIEANEEEEEGERQAVEEITKSIDQVLLDDSSPSAVSTSTSISPPIDDSAIPPTSPKSTPDEFTANDENDESEGGEWITPSNVSKHRSHDLGLLPTGSGTGKDAESISAACMTGDFAVQNVLLGMGLGLVGEGGKRIGKVKSFVLRCHACFK